MNVAMLCRFSSVKMRSFIPHSSYFLREVPVRRILGICHSDWMHPNDPLAIKEFPSPVFVHRECCCIVPIANDCKACS